MNTVTKESIQIRTMRDSDLKSVLSVEESAYCFPWSETVFQDCLQVAYCCRVLEYNNLIIAHAVMSIAAGEAHILNIAVHIDYQKKGYGRYLLEYLLDFAFKSDVNTVFLEVRASNFRAIKLYIDMGFNEIGTRRNYYPAKIGREDALIYARTIVRERKHV